MIPIDEMIKLRSVGAAQKEQGENLVKQASKIEDIAQSMLDKKDHKKEEEGSKKMPPQAKAAIIIALKKKVRPLDK